MPQIPVTNKRQIKRDDFQVKQSNVKVNAETFSGGAVANKLVEGVQSVTDTVGTMFDEMDKAEVDRASTELTKLRNKTIHDPKSGYSKVKGKRAFEEMKTYQEGYNKQVEEIEKKLTNPNQRGMFQKFKAKNGAELSGQMDRHASVEAANYDKIQSSESVIASQEDAVLNYTDNGKIGESLASQEKTIRDHGKRAGLPPEAIENQLRSAESSTHLGIVNRMLNNDQDQLAKAYYDNIKGSKRLDADTRARMDKMTVDGAVDGEAKRFTDDVMLERSSKGEALSMTEALAKARKHFTNDSKKSDETVKRIKNRYSEIKNAKEQAASKSFADVGNIVEEKKSRDSIPSEQWAQLSISQKNSVDARIRQLSGGGKAVTDWRIYTDLKTMAAHPATRDKFIKLDPYIDRPNLADAQYKEIVDLRAGLISGDAKAIEEADGIRTDRQVVNDVLRTAEINVEDHPDSVSQFNRLMDGQVRKYKQETGQKRVPNEKIQQIAEDFIIKAKVDGTGLFGFFKTEKKLFEFSADETAIIDTDDIPTESMKRIKRTLNKLGKPLTDKNILDTFKEVMTTRKKLNVR